MKLLKANRHVTDGLMEIPEKLRRDEFRFCLVEKYNNMQLPEKQRGKKPLESDWRKTAYKWDDAKIKNYLNIGYNIGIVCEYGNLVVIDFDNKGFQDELFPLLPDTFRVKSGRGLWHCYYITDVPLPKGFGIYVVENGKKNPLADIRATGNQVICPPSTHKSGNKYEVVNDVEIHKMPRSELLALLSPYFDDDDLKPKSVKHSNLESDVVEEIKNRVKVSDLISSYGITPNFRKPIRCPMHIGQGEHCFSIKKSDDLWNCFHTNCMKGGDIFTLVMEKESCDFKEALKILADKANISLEKQKTEGVTLIDDRPILVVNNYLHNVEAFWTRRPFFYDKSKTFWFWNKNLKFYARVDEVDVLVAINTELRLTAEVVTQGVVNSYLTAFRIVGRKKIPKEPEKTWVQFEDALIDIVTGEHLVPSPDYFLPHIIPHKVGLSIDTPILDKYIIDWVGEEWAATLYEILAYCMLPDYPLNFAFCLVGSGSNGKTVYLNVVERLIGEKNIASSDLEMLSASNNHFESAKLYKKLACIITETSDKTLHNTTIFKQLTGHDLMRIEFKGKDGFDAHNYAKILIATNNLPSTTDSSSGFFRRWIIIDFPNEFDGKKDIFSTIPESEYENLCLKSCNILKKILETREFTNQGTINERMQRFLDRSNPILKFLKEFCEVDVNGEIPKPQFKDNLIKWLKGKGYKVVNDVELSKQMKALDYTDAQRRTDTTYWRVWQGLKWKLEMGDMVFTTTEELSSRDSRVSTLFQSKPYMYVANAKSGANPAILVTLLQESNNSSTQNNLLDIVLLRNLLMDAPDGIMPIERLIEIGFTDTQIEKWKHDGEIFEPKKGYIKLL